MFVHYRSQGFILKKVDRGEADQFFIVFTKDFGKLEILGKAIRKISSKLRAGAELFYLSEIEFIQGKTYKTLTDAILIEKFENIRKNLKRLQIAYKISEILDSLVKGQEADEKIWNLLKEIFNKLNSYNLKPKTFSLIYYYFLWNLLSILGYQPQLYYCVLCQKKLLPEKFYFSPKQGGIVCQSCYKKTEEIFREGEKIEPDMVKILRIILEKDWQILSKLKIEVKYMKFLELLSKNYFSFILGEINYSHTGKD